MEIEVLEPKGYCAGVSRAIEIAYKAKKENPHKNIYIVGLLVHNLEVVSKLEIDNIHTLYEKGKSLKELIDLAPKESVLVFTAHGHDETLNEYAISKGHIIYDAVCPKVESNIKKAKEEIAKGHQIIYIGDEGHPETNAMLSVSNLIYLINKKLLNNYQKITDCSPFVINQTTFNTLDIIDIYNEIKKHFPNARISEEICSTTRLRQDAIKNLNNRVDLLIVLGSTKSSNTKRLFEIAKASHPSLTSILIENKDQLDEKIIENKKYIAIASGASTPPASIDELVEYLKSF